MNRQWLWLVSLLGSFLLSACTVGPDYHKPDVATPAAWRSAGVADEKQTIDQAWWREFHDPVLCAFMDQALSENLTVHIAVERVRQARASVEGAGATLWPSIQGGGQAQRARNNMPIAFTRKPYDVFNTRFDTVWEIDLFGKNRRTLEAAVSRVGAEEALYHQALVTLQADLAKAYITLRGLQEQVRITKENIAAQIETLALTQKQLDAGQSNKLDVLRAEAQLWQTKSQLPFYEGAVQSTFYQLDVLLGEQPGAAENIIRRHESSARKAHIPVMNTRVVFGAPAQIIQQRPDVQAAERLLAAATAVKGSAIAAQYPTISLSGFFGLQSGETAGFFTSVNKSWGMGGGITMPILTFGKIQSAIDQADAQKMAAFLAYKQTILVALSEVERAFVAYVKEEERRQAILKNVQAIREAIVLAKKRYQEGFSSFLEVLDAERTLYMSESQLAQSSMDVSLNLVFLYKALGGGWQPVVAEQQAVTAP